MARNSTGPKHIFYDALLDNMTGRWKLTGKVADRNAEHSIQAEWVLNHQFLRVHEKDHIPAAENSIPYEALVMIGYDNAGERYVAHWMDVYGGRFSETLGYGTRLGEEIRFIFDYPDGPLRTTFHWKPQLQQWEWLMVSKDKSGQWAQFADLMLVHSRQ